MGRSELCWIAIAFVFLLLVPEVVGWGKEGHYVVCKIAEVSIFKSFLSISGVCFVKLSVLQKVNGEYEIVGVLANTGNT